MAREETILEVQEQINLYDVGIEGVYVLPIEMADFIVEGEKYEVVWSEDTYLVTAVIREWTDPETGETILFPTLGNAAFLTYLTGATYEETDEPFLIYQIEGEKAIISSDATISGLGIYTYSEPDGIVLKDPLGRSITYGEYSKLLITRASGVQSIFSEGEAEATTISELDFTNGDMNVVPAKKKLFSKVTIAQPATLLPENIKRDVTIAGIVGTAIGEGQEKTVALALADGNQEVTPDDGYLLSKITIEKPATLLPENIINGVDIAGVVGTVVAGGSGGLEDISTETDMDNVLIEENVGNAYRYTGETGEKYVSGDIYIVEGV